MQTNNALSTPVTDTVRLTFQSEAEKTAAKNFVAARENHNKMEIVVPSDLPERDGNALVVHFADANTYGREQLISDLNNKAVEPVAPTFVVDHYAFTS